MTYPPDITVKNECFSLQKSQVCGLWNFYPNELFVPHMIKITVQEVEIAGVSAYVAQGWEMVVFAVFSLTSVLLVQN